MKIISFRKHPVTATVLGALLLLSLVAGCGGPGPALQPVRGVVTCNQEPVPDCSVLFQNDALGIYLMAQPDQQGHYEIAQASGKGLPEGEYRVAVLPPEVVIETGKALPPPPDLSRIPLRYRSPNTSGLTCRVTAGENTFDIQMLP